MGAKREQVEQRSEWYARAQVTLLVDARLADERSRASLEQAIAAAFRVGFSAGREDSGSGRTVGRTVAP